MSALLAQFHFLRPWWLLALAVLPWLLWQAAQRGRGVQALARLVDAELLAPLLQGQAVRQRLPLGLLALAWLLAVLALAGPAWSRVAQPLYAQRAAQVVAISLSQRMLAHDVAPSRIDRARYKAHDLLEANRDGSNALIGYAGEAFVVAPLSADVHSLGSLLDAMAPDTMPSDGENAAAAIRRGVALIRDANSGGGSLVLIADTAGPAAQAAAREARAAGVRVSVLGVGTPQGAPVPLPGGGFLHDAKGDLLLAGRDDAALAAVAAAGGGRYVLMSADGSDVAALKAELRAGKVRASQGLAGDEWQDRGPWLLLLLLPLAALAFRRGWLLLLPLVLLPMLPSNAYAASWRDLWQRRDQQAASALARGDAKAAMQLAQDPAWRGAAAYRAGDYAAAAKALHEVGGSDGAYNLGNALAREGKYPEAIAAYDRALQRDPANADAAANRKAVEDWLRQQPKPPSQQKQQASGSSAKDQQGQGGQGEQGKSPSGQGEQGKPGSSAQPPGEPAQDKGEQAPPPQGDASKDARGAQGKQGDQQGQQAQPSSAEQQAQAAKAQQALKQQLDKALGEAGKADQHAPPTHQLGVTGADDTTAKLPTDLRRALQRVPDDPGALLRRKFELEYQHRHGGARNEEEP